MTDQAATQNSLIVTIDEDGIIVTFESERLMGSNPKVEVSDGCVKVSDDKGLLVIATDMPPDIISVLEAAPTASLVGVVGGDGEDLFDVHANCPITEPENVLG